MPQTMILEPLCETDLDENDADVLKDTIGRIRSLLNSIKDDETMTFVEYLVRLDLSEQQYIKAIRFSLKHSTLLLKRSPPLQLESTATIHTCLKLGELKWIFNSY